MNRIITSFAILALFIASFAIVPTPVDAACSYNGYINSGGKCAKSFKNKNKYEYRYDREEDDDDDIYWYDRRPYPYYYRSTSDQALEDYIEHLLKIVERLRDELNDRDNDNNRDDEPIATTRSATDIEDDSAVLRGSVDMNDFRNGRVFFVYGEDEGQVDDIERDHDRYNDIDEDGEDLQKILIDPDLDGTRSFSQRILGLDNNTNHYFRICVEYEDEDDDDTLECGNVLDFETDN